MVGKWFWKWYMRRRIDTKPMEDAHSANADLLESWMTKTDGPRQENPALQRRQRIARLKVVTASVSALIILSLVFWPLFDERKDGLKLTFSQSESRQADSPKMIKPRFHGLDEKGQPYNLTADEAVQESEEIVMLQNLNGDITLKDNGWISLLSETGAYHTQEKKLDLNGSVNVFMDSGYELFTEAAHVDLKESMAAGNSHVVVHGPMGQLEAEGFVVRERGKNLFFHGGVELVGIPGGQQ